MKTLICTILLGTALVGSGAWAATDMTVPASSKVANAEGPIVRATGEALIQKRAQLKELLQKYPKPQGYLPQFEAYEVENDIRNLRKINEKLFAEKREEYNDEEWETVEIIQRNVLQAVKRWYDQYEPAAERHKEAMKSWKIAHPDIVRLERETNRVF